jgi:acetyltransferase-like isoleucine patch superfamily enzyme
MISKLLNEIKSIIIHIIIYYPETEFGQMVRRKYWSHVHGSQMGRNALVERGALIGQKGMVRIGDNFMIGASAVIAAGDSHPIWIGDNVAISRFSWVRTANHAFDDINIPFMQQGHEYKTIEYKESKYSIVIEDDVWIAANAIVLSGAHVGTGSIVGAGSVISGTIPPYSIIVGNPGRVVKSRKKNL